jgi:hypothetical protein
MVNHILDHLIDMITMRALPGLSPDLFQDKWGVRRLPLLNKVAIPSTQVVDISSGVMATTTRAMEEVTEEGRPRTAQAGAHTCGVPPLPTGRMCYLGPPGAKRLRLAHSYGKIEGKTRVKMLIDSGSERNVMSKGLWEQAQELLPIDTDICWSIGSANSTHGRVYRVCHSIMVDISGVEITGPVFVLEGSSQQFILGWPWEQQARAQYYNPDDGSLYISIMSRDD